MRAPRAAVALAARRPNSAPVHGLRHVDTVLHDAELPHVVDIGLQEPELGSVHQVAEGGGMHHHYERRVA